MSGTTVICCPVPITFGRPLRLEERWEEEQLDELFGPPQIQTVEFFFPESPSPAPEYVVIPVDFGDLPSNYLSTRLCIIDFDHAFSAENAPKQLSHIPYHYLAPENIFTLANGPPADVWALGCILFELRDSITLFDGFFGSSPLSTESRMCEVLGSLPQEWMALPFEHGYPVHEPLQPGIEYRTVGDWTERHGFTLDTEVGRIREPRRPASVSKTASGREWLCLHVPAFWDPAKREEFYARYLKPLGKEDAALFTDLLSKVFNYNPQTRITTRQILTHPLLKGTSQAEPSNAGSAASSAQSLPVRPKPHTPREVRKEEREPERDVSRAQAQRE
ncbi:kinase-like domain-containing protein [Chaetomium strumarium]|uniref:Kinase-like domain-containing protein n=1 Tax=Chaetomium strumarium TaxID=1170767 RepID=A0AAJ0M0U9_9PEZI|nr:kinase-like domain-containing protein [Chaetomium strumarium]